MTVVVNIDMQVVDITATAVDPSIISVLDNNILSQDEVEEARGDNDDSTQDVTDEYVGFTAVHQAAFMGDIVTLQELHQAGADLYAIDSRGNIPIVYASEMGHRAVVEYLASDILLLAATAGDLELVQYALSFFESNVDLNNIRNARGATALHLAAAADSLEIVKLLCGYGLDINIMDNSGLMPLDYVGEESGMTECAVYFTSQMIGGASTVSDMPDIAE